MDVALQRLHVVFCLDRAGLVGEDGPTHHGVFDLSFLRTVPGLQIMSPANEAELVDMLHTAIHAEGPVVIRYPRGAGMGVALPVEPTILEPGRAQVLRRGSEVAILGIGRMVGVAEGAADLMAEDGLSPSVVNMRWLKPLDLETVAWAASHRLVVTIEENTGIGGLGGAVLEALSDLGSTTPVLRLAVPDCFVTHGAMNKLLAEVGLTPEAVRGAILGRLMDDSCRDEERADGQTPGRRRAR